MKIFYAILRLRFGAVPFALGLFYLLGMIAGWQGFDRSLHALLISLALIVGGILAGRFFRPD